MSEKSLQTDPTWNTRGGWNNPGLTGEQQTLLALNYRDLGQVDKAVQYCQAAIASYKDMGASEMFERAEGLLAELQAG